MNADAKDQDSKEGPARRPFQAMGGMQQTLKSLAIIFVI